MVAPAMAILYIIQEPAMVAPVIYKWPTVGPSRVDSSLSVSDLRLRDDGSAGCEPVSLPVVADLERAVVLLPQLDSR